MKKDVARFVDKHGLDRELIEVKLSSPMTRALVSVKERDRCTTQSKVYRREILLTRIIITC